MLVFRFRNRGLGLASVALGCAVALAPEAALAGCPVLDDFGAPATPRSAVVWGLRDSPTAVATLQDTSPSILGGIRDTAIDIYGNPQRGIAALALGGGVVSVTQAPGVVAETQLSYGAFTRPTPGVGGPLLGLDLSSCKALQADFAGAEDGLNFVVVYYTSAPLSSTGYYLVTGLNIAPTSSGAPLSFPVDFGTSPFNWKRVDGVVVLVNRSGPTPHTSYTIDNLAFVPR